MQTKHSYLCSCSYSALNLYSPVFAHGCEDKKTQFSLWILNLKVFHLENYSSSSSSALSALSLLWYNGNQPGKILHPYMPPLLLLLIYGTEILDRGALLPSKNVHTRMVLLCLLLKLLIYNWEILDWGTFLHLFGSTQINSLLPLLLLMMRFTRVILIGDQGGGGVR